MTKTSPPSSIIDTTDTFHIATLRGEFVDLSAEVNSMDGARYKTGCTNETQYWMMN